MMKLLKYAALFALCCPPLAAASVQVPPGFVAELIYSVPREEQGSWVCLTVDPQGRIIAGDQHGGLYRVSLPPPGEDRPAAVEKLATPVGGAHGLLYAFDSLYVMVSERTERGLWRLRDTTGDDQFDSAEHLIALTGSGEHGPHGLALGPDGRSIYFACGNFTEVPEGARSLPVAWDEDHLLPRMWDARGHAKGKLAPGGFIARTDPDGKTVELVSIGFRNHYDLAFDSNGELFTFDSDMEWDLGTPWYVPTRIVHHVPGADYGWRSGAGRWPAYYADSLPGVLDIGPGSPTGVTFGTGARFPARYQRALFAADWTFGTLYAVHLSPEGASYRAEKEEFLTGKPLPLTDVLIHPQDGAMYIATGGRRTESALYRIRYVGGEPTAPVHAAPLSPEGLLRRSLERWQVEGPDSEAVAAAWPHLGDPDRTIRFVARTVLERRPAEFWASRALSESRPLAAIEAAIALARTGDPALQSRLLESLGRFDLDSLAPELRLPWLRAWQLAFTRMGKPDAPVRRAVAESLEAHFPHADPFASRELADLLVFLESPAVVSKAVPLLAVPEAGNASDDPPAALLARNPRYGLVGESVALSRPDRQQIAYAYTLRVAQTGWTPELRRAYFGWFPATAGWRGGASFNGFLENIRTEALALVGDEAERTALDKLSQRTASGFAAPSIRPQGPGRAYTVDEAATLAGTRLQGRDFERGRAMYAATACLACHRLGGEGTSIGPDLSSAGRRYTVRDLLESIIEPSRVISDAYAAEEIRRKDGTILTGRVVAEENNRLILVSNPFAPAEQTGVPLSEIAERRQSPVSIMPPGLINGMNPEELKDLLAFILAGGNPADPMFSSER